MCSVFATPPAVATSRRLALVGPPGAGKSSWLWHRHRALIDAGTAPERILVLVGPATRERWHEAGTPARTLDGWIRETLAQAMPTAVFLTDRLARYAMGALTEAWRRDRQWQSRLATPWSAQGNQLWDGYALAVHHGLTPSEAATRLEAAWTALAGAREGLREAAEAQALYADTLAAHGLLDRPARLAAYRDRLLTDRAHRRALAERFDVLLLDDVEETSLAEQTVWQALSDILPAAAAALTTPGGLAPEAAPETAAERLRGWDHVTLDSRAPLTAVGLALMGRPAVPWMAERLAHRLHFATRGEMLAAAAADLAAAGGRSALVAPQVDDGLRVRLERALAPHGLALGTARRSAARVGVVRQLLTMAAIARGETPPREALAELIERLAAPDAIAAARLADAFPQALPASLAPLREKAAQLPLASFFPWAFTLWRRLAAEAGRGAGEDEAIAAEQVARAAAAFTDAQALWEDDGFARFLADWRTLVPPVDGSPTALELWEAEAFARRGRPVDFVFWLDTGAEAWHASRARELANPYALSREGPYGLDDEDGDAREHLGRLVTACCARARKAMRWYGSALDDEGRDQSGALPALVARLGGAS